MQIQNLTEDDEYDCPLCMPSEMNPKHRVVRQVPAKFLSLSLQKMIANKNKNLLERKARNSKLNVI